MENPVLKLPLSLNVIITEKGNKPAVELRRLTVEPQLVRAVVAAAFHGIPIAVQPQFTNPTRSIGTLIQKGVLYIKGEKYYFNI